MSKLKKTDRRIKELKDLLQNDPNLSDELNKLSALIGEARDIPVEKHGFKLPYSGAKSICGTAWAD